MTIDLGQIRFVGSSLNRPECVVAHASGLLLMPDWTEPGGISLITPSGEVHRILATAPDPGVDLPLHANGIALEPGGTVLIAHLGAEHGGIYRLWPNGRVEVVTDHIAGKPMPPANFVTRDSQGRLWITISTTKVPRALDYRPNAGTGLIALHEAGETCVVADGLGYTNECLLSEDEATLWVNETFARKLTAYKVEDSRLTERRIVAEFGPGTFPDGLAPTADGSLLITSIVSNRVLSVQPDGRIETLLEDADSAHLDWVEAAFQAGDMGRPHIDDIRSACLKNISNLAFGGPELNTAFLGCLLGDRIAAFDCPLTGRPLPHWACELGPLANYLTETS